MAMEDIMIEELLGHRWWERPGWVNDWIELRYEDGQLPDAETQVLLDIIQVRRSRVVLEIGTYMGATTRRMAELVGRWGGIVVTVDLPEGVGTPPPGPPPRWSDPHLIAKRDVGREFRGQRCVKWIEQIRADTAEWDWKEGYGADVIFIDGSHTYEYCRNDSEKAAWVVAAGGMIVWHDADANHPGVTQLLEEWWAAGKNVRKIAGTRLAIYD